MQQVNYSFSPNDVEKLFIEKGLESLYKGTLDSYRVRLNNPKTIIEEVINVTQQVKDRILQRNEYVVEVCNEAQKLLEQESSGLKWLNINKEFYISTVLKGSKKTSSYSRIIQASKLILRDNQNYTLQLLTNIEEIISLYSSGNGITNEVKLLQYCDYSFSELLNKGFSKQYLYQFFRTIFVHAGDDTMSFADRFHIWKDIFSQLKRDYQVIYKLISNRFQFRELALIDSGYIQVNKRFRAQLPSTTGNELRQFLELNKKEKLIAVEVEASDHYKAIELSRFKLSSDLDLYHIGFNGISNTIGKKAGVIDLSNPQKASTEPSNYQLDGYTRGNKEILATLVGKVNALSTNNVSNESINKLLSGFRYLRMGTEAVALEAKLLNYWIGLEYIFTSFKNDMRTVDRIRENFTNCHSLIYIKRNLFAFHKAISRLNISEYITDYNDNLEYLNKFDTYEIIKTNSPNTLMSIRANQLQKWVSDPSSIERSLYNHKNNLRWNISRLYRLRNEIVHNAAIKINIKANVSHLRYYLTFSLNSILSFMAETPFDANNDGKITIEDYFITQEIRLSNLKNKTIIEYNNIENPMEIFY